MPNRQQGFSLIEVLVTMIIMAIGLMGLAAMQMVSTKNVNNSQSRTVASYLAYDMAERMRSNPEGLDGGHYNSIDGTEGAPTKNCQTLMTECSASELAASDAYHWNQTVQSNIINGGLGAGSTGTVSVAAGIYTIGIDWQEQDRNANGDTTLSIQLIP